LGKVSHVGAAWARCGNAIASAIKKPSLLIDPPVQDISKVDASAREGELVTPADQRGYSGITHRRIAVTRR
jgi:hypothetical protein